MTQMLDDCVPQGPDPIFKPLYLPFGSPKKTHQSPVSDQASARAFAGADLLASPLPSKSASSFRAREAGTRAFNMRLSRPGTILERFLTRPLRPSDTHCSTLIGFIGIVFGSRANFSSTAVFVTPAASTVT